MDVGSHPPSSRCLEYLGIDVVLVQHALERGIVTDFSAHSEISRRVALLEVCVIPFRIVSGCEGPGDVCKFHSGDLAAL